MEADGRAQVQVAHRVAADDQEVLLPQLGHAVFHPAGGAQGLPLDEVVQADAQLPAIAETSP